MVYPMAKNGWLINSNIYIYMEIVTVASYRLVYSTSSTTIINEAGVIPPGATSFTPSDVLDGSLLPMTPYETQTVTVSLVRNETSSLPFYFTIASKGTNGVGCFLNYFDKFFEILISLWFGSQLESYPAPMVYLSGNGTEEITTTPTTTTTTTSTTTQTTTTKASTVTTKASTVTTKPTTTTKPSTAASTASVPTSTITFQPGGAQHAVISSTVFLFSIVSILIFAF